MYEELVKSLRICEGACNKECILYNSVQVDGDTCQNRLCDMAADAIEELSKPKWIPIKTRPMTNEELKYWEELYEYGLSEEEAVIYCSPLPEDGQEVLVCSKYGHVWLDTFCDDGDGIGFETTGNMDGIIAWMSLLEPPKEEE